MEIGVDGAADDDPARSEHVSFHRPSPCRRLSCSLGEEVGSIQKVIREINRVRLAGGVPSPREPNPSRSPLHSDDQEGPFYG